MADLKDTRRKCTADRVDGLACRAYAMESGPCFWHDPSQTDLRKDAALRGGSRRSVFIPIGEPLGPEEARGVVRSVLEGLVSGAIDAKTANAAAYLLQVNSRLTKTEEFERRLTAMEKRVVNQRR